MIYRADFRLKSLNVNLISATVFANISRTLFEVFDEEKALDFIKLIMESRTLISDMLLKDKLPYTFFNDVLFESQENNLKEKREKFREWKEKQKIDYDLKDKENTRIRIKIDRRTNSAEEGFLFYEDRKMYNGIYSIYVYTENKKITDLFELVFSIFEKTGIGNDLSIGLGQIEFIRNDGKIFTEDNEMYEKYKSKSDFKCNISSTIISEDVLKDYKFIRYKVSRYDARSLNIVKPTYYLFEKGSTVEILNLKGPYLHKYSKGNNDIYIYNCVFPISFGMEGRM